MAGEWIKFECNLPGKPEVMAITAAMGWDDADLTVGKLMRLFTWFDQQTTDGNAVGVTPALLDKFIGVTGFVQALVNVRWIVADERGLSLHNFGKHNGETAKARAQTAKRVANHRSNASTVTGSVTPALAKEEKNKNTNTVDQPDGFESFWSAYPKKVGKPAAIKAFRSAKISGHLPDVLADIEDKAGSEAWTKAGGQFVPNPATYLNQRRWEDQIDSAKSDPFAGAI